MVGNSVELVPLAAPFLHNVIVPAKTRTLSQVLQTDEIIDGAKFVLVEMFLKHSSQDDFVMTMGTVEDGCRLSIDSNCLKNLNKVNILDTSDPLHMKTHASFFSTSRNRPRSQNLQNGFFEQIKRFLLRKSVNED